MGNQGRLPVIILLAALLAAVGLLLDKDAPMISGSPVQPIAGGAEQIARGGSHTRALTGEHAALRPRSVPICEDEGASQSSLSGAGSDPLDGISDKLSLSSSPDHLFVAALLQRDADKKAELLEQAVSGAPADPFLIWSAFETCSNKHQSVSCSMDFLEQRLIEVDGGNSETWSRIATNRYSAGHTELALEAMEYAAASSESRIYWTEVIEAVERALAATTQLPFEKRAEYAVGVEAAIARNGNQIEMCRVMSTSNARWAEVCLRYGRLLEQQASAQFLSYMGLVLQRETMNARSDTDGINTVKQRLEAARRMAEGEAEHFDPVIEYQLFRHPKLFYAYLARAQADGQALARQQFKIEASQLLEEQPELACIPKDHERITTP